MTPSRRISTGVRSNSKEDQNSEFISRFDKGRAQVDQAKIDQFKQIRQLQELKKVQRKREIKRLALKEGEQSVRVKQLAARLRFDQARFNLWDEEIEKMSIQTPVIDDKTWLVHGRVLDAERKGIKGLIIGLGTSKGEWIQELGYAGTDQRGYFSIKYQLSKRELEKLKAMIKNKLADFSSLAETAPIGYFDKQVILLVSDRSQKVIYKDKQPLLIQPGSIDYREIVLKDKYTSAPPHGGSEPSIVDQGLIKYVGRILDKQGKGIKGLSVRLADKDLAYNEVFNSVTTDERGEFEIKLKADKYKEVIAANPDLFLKVTDKEGVVVYEEKKKIRLKAGSVENFDITLKHESTPEPTLTPADSRITEPADTHTSTTTKKASKKSTKKATTEKTVKKVRRPKKVTKRKP